MKQSKIISTLILVGLVGSSCNASTTQSNQTFTEIPATITLTPTFTATLTPTLIPSPTATFTPSPTAVAGGNGDLVLSCVDTGGSKDQDKIFTYEIDTATLKPNAGQFTNNEDFFQFGNVVAASPSGRVIFWRRYNNFLISDSTFSTNKLSEFFAPDWDHYPNTYQLVSDDYIFFAVILNSFDYIKGEPPWGIEYYLHNLRNNETIFLGSQEDGEFYRTYLSPTGRYLAIEYLVGDFFAIDPFYINIIDLQEKRILDLTLHGQKPEWIANDKLKYIPSNADIYFSVVDIGTGEFSKLRTASLSSPDGNWLVHTELVNHNFQLFLQNTSDGTDISLTEPSYIWIYPWLWSPNGKQIIYMFPTETTRQIRIYDVSTKVTTLLLEFNFLKTEREWASEINAIELDGYLYFFSSRSDQYNWSWSPDGKWFTMGFENDEELRPINHFDFFLCRSSECKLIKPPDTTYCTKTIWTSQ